MIYFIAGPNIIHVHVQNCTCTKLYMYMYMHVCVHTTSCKGSEYMYVDVPVPKNPIIIGCNIIDGDIINHHCDAMHASGPWVQSSGDGRLATDLHT